MFEIKQSIVFNDQLSKEDMEQLISNETKYNLQLLDEEKLPVREWVDVQSFYDSHRADLTNN
ncbi:hypothetical protein [Bacillus sp. FJAT-52991]|uniref:Uncharacterized protein n=1 Tax=Bacillus kandeliae TaxID=3129297 RepID=A0ABZ2N4C2_9BACI